ncbi:MAG: flagellar export chaperone FliS [Phycisphaerales bacterium JB059]
MTETQTTNAYLTTRVMTASPEQLRLLLLEGSVRFANQAKHGLETGDHETSHAGFTQCRNIILELISTINAEAAPELADRVKGLYTFLYQELVEASFQKDPARVGKVIELLEYEVETWRLLLEELAQKGETATVEPTPEPGAGPSLSIQA